MEVWLLSLQGWGYTVMPLVVLPHPQGFTSLSPSREGLRGIFRRILQAPQSLVSGFAYPVHLVRVACCPEPGTLLPARQKVAVQGAGTGGICHGSGDRSPGMTGNWARGGVAASNATCTCATSMATCAGREKVGHKSQGSLHEVPPVLVCDGGAACAHIHLWYSVLLIPRRVFLAQNACHEAIGVHNCMD